MNFRVLACCAALALLFNACQTIIFEECDTGPCLVTINLIDQNGVSETVSNEDRLEQYSKVDFLSPQPYRKVLRVYKRDELGNISACITSYHPNGQLHQYLELVNGRACGSYRSWYENGACQVNASLIGGAGDLSQGDEQTWIFEGLCQAWDSAGHLQAEFVYVKGQLEGTSLYYHSNGSIWKKVPYNNGKVNGELEVYLENGTLFQTTSYMNGEKEGCSKKYWADSSLAAEETFCKNRLMEATYLDTCGTVISEIHQGTGFRALFCKTCLCELQEYQKGVQEGMVKLYDSLGNVYKVYNLKDDVKHGEEIDFYNGTANPQLVIQWSEGKIHGITKTFYPNGTQESQREMAGNKKNGIFTAWYSDGSIMLIEEYDHDKLIKGEYYKKGDRFPVSAVIDGKGTVTFFDSEGIYLRKIAYRNGRPEL